VKLLKIFQLVQHAETCGEVGGMARGDGTYR
jgi:hypothetical protein